MKRVDVASALIFDSTKEKVLLVKNRKGDSSYWSPPGGAVENGETLEQAVLREIKEETGYDIEVIGLYSVREMFFIENSHHAIIFTFLARIIDGEINFMDPDNEVVDIEWLDIPTANELMPSIPDIETNPEGNIVRATYCFEGTK
jgi:8-oxo-dGTP diphosphatase